MNNFDDKHTLVVRTTANKLISENSFINEMNRHFSFPSYFGENMDALYDCMRDLTWIPYKRIVIRVKNAKKLIDRSGGFDFVDSFAVIKEHWDQEKDESGKLEKIFILEYL